MNGRALNAAAGFQHTMSSQLCYGARVEVKYTKACERVYDEYQTEQIC